MLPLSFYSTNRARHITVTAHQNRHIVRICVSHLKHVNRKLYIKTKFLLNAIKFY